MSTDTLDELAAFGHPGEPTGSTPALANLVERNPVPAALAAAAAGAALMALVSLMARREPESCASPSASASASALAAAARTASRGIDLHALKRQLAELADRIGDAAPMNTATQRVGDVGDAIADGWGSLREHALDALNRFEPQASAVVKAARDNPLWTALIVGAVGALVGSQLLGKPAEVDAAPSDPGADA